jgi:hypothetical protein
MARMHIIVVSARLLACAKDMRKLRSNLVRMRAKGARGPKKSIFGKSAVHAGDYGTMYSPSSDHPCILETADIL